MCSPSPASAQPAVNPDAAPVPVNVYVDVVCPWCYIGKRRLDAAVDAFTTAGGKVALRYMPFQLDPDASAEACELMPKMVEKFGGEAQAAQTVTHITQIAATEGIELDYDAALSVNTQSAHRVLAWTGDRNLDAQGRLLDELYAAYFTRGENIADAEVLQKYVDQIGLDLDVASYLATDEGIDAVNAQQEAARAAGITSVPTYVFAARWGVSGAQEVSTLLTVLQQVQAQADAQPGAGGGGGCCGGGCCG
ncbi:DsbA family protein [Epidermidibacterium keratini]